MKWPFGKRIKLSATPPTHQVVRSAQKLFEEPENRYELYRDMFRTDPEVYGAVMTTAMMVSHAFKGMVIHAEKEETEIEKEILELCKQVAHELDFGDLFFVATLGMLIFGDLVFAIEKSNEIWRLVPLPITKLTILEKRNQVEQIDAQIFATNFYVLNEYDPDKRQIWNRDEILHFSLNSRIQEVRDIHDRYTLGVWSIPPLHSLKTTLLEKRNAQINDILWRDRNVPREHHKLDLSAFDPAYFAGATRTEQISTAKAAAQAEVEKYAESIERTDVDRGWVTGNTVEIDYVEPRTASYASPNDLVTQLNESIMAAVGIPISALRGSGKSSYASELFTGNYAYMRVSFLARRIARVLIKFLKQYIEEVRKDLSTELDKIDIKLQLILDKDRGDLARTGVLMREMGVFTEDELRDLMGHEPLKDEEREYIVKKEPSRRADTPEEIGADAPNWSSDAPHWPRPQERRQNVT